MAALLATFAVAAAPAGAAPVELTSGHVDYAARMVDGALRSQVKDGTGGGAPVWREPRDVVFRVAPAAKTTLPARPELASLGRPGSTVWVIPQLQRSGVLWAGWNTEELTPAAVSGPLSWRLVAVDGPGAVAIFATGTFGDVDVLFNSADGLPDARDIPLGTHAHGNWAFTQPGAYHLTFEMSATAPDGATLRDTQTLPVEVVPAPADGSTPPPGGGDGGDASQPTPKDETPETLTLQPRSARLHGRTLALGLRLSAPSRVTVIVHRGRRAVARLRPRSVGAGKRTLRLRLRRPLAPGRYRVRLEARAGTAKTVRWLPLRVRVAVRAGVAAGMGGPTLPVRGPALAGAAARGSAIVLGEGHLDYGARLIRGRIQSQIKDGTSGSAPGQIRWREPSEVVIAVKPAARTRLPRGGGLDSLGDPGDPVWVIPQVQQPGVVWAGWNTEELRRRDIAGSVRWRLTALDGPGRFALFQTGSFGDERILFDSSNGLPDRTAVPLGTHAHGNWAFTRQGTYRLTFEMSARRRSGARVSDTETLTVAVGDVHAAAVNPGEQSSGSGEGDSADGSAAASGSGGGGQADPDADPASSGAGGDDALPLTGRSLVPVLGGGLALVLVGFSLRGRVAAPVSRRSIGDGIACYRPAHPVLPAAVALLVLGVVGCSERGGGGDRGNLRVVTTTGILADLVRQVGGERVSVDSLVPAGGDPHSHEPTPADALEVAEADVTFTNHLLLEEHALIKTIDSNAPADAPNVSLAESAESYGAHVIPLVEDVGLDVLWLGLRVRGDGRGRGATRSSDVHLRATRVEGPGELIVYLTEALGEPVVYFDSSDGLDRRDATTLPPAAHTHLNWAFTEPGVYRLTLAATLDGGQRLGQGTFTFAVGVDHHTAANRTVLDDGHTDLTVDLDRGALYAYSDAREPGADQLELPAGEVVIDVPNRALETVPDERAFAFLGRPGARIFQLPQAVLGKHVHGEIDPHLWQDVANAKAYVQLIRDTLKRADPDGAAAYRSNARAYLRRLDETDAYVRRAIDRIPRERRQLVTTHDAFGYLADAYDMTVAGFVVPNPAHEPSAEQVRTLTETIANLDVGAVFMEPNLRQRATVLEQVARDRGVRVCKLYGDAFDEQAPSYVAMMRHNAAELRRCLGTDS